MSDSHKKSAEYAYAGSRNAEARARSRPNDERRARPRRSSARNRRDRRDRSGVALHPRDRPRGHRVGSGAIASASRARRAHPCTASRSSSRTTSTRRGFGRARGQHALSCPPFSDADVVASLRAAGMVVLGKTNLSEWANFRSEKSTSGWSAMGGQTHNPFALERSPSGSSSGSAVAVAAGLSPIAIRRRPTARSSARPRFAASLGSSRPSASLVAAASSRSPRARTPQGRWRARSPTPRRCCR